MHGGAHEGRLARIDVATETAEADTELAIARTALDVKGFGDAEFAGGTPPTTLQILVDITLMTIKKHKFGRYQHC